MTLVLSARPLYLGGGITPLLLPGADVLESWHYALRGLTLGSQLLEFGASISGNIVGITGNLNQSIGLVLDVTVAGLRGTAKFDAYIDGGVVPFATNLTTGASTAIPGLNITTAWPVGSYTVDNAYKGVVGSWSNLTPKTRTLIAPAALTSHPTIAWQAKNGKPTITSDGTNGKRLDDLTSDWASVLASGIDTPFTVIQMVKTDTVTPNAVRSWLALKNQTGSAEWSASIKNGTNDYYSAKIDNVGAAAVSQGGALDLNYHVLTWRQNGTTCDLRKDGVAVFTGDGQNVGDSTFDAVSVLSQLGASSMIGAIGEMCTYRTALTNTEVNAIEAYMLSNWGF
jgi:hypothetical protein